MRLLYEATTVDSKFASSAQSGRKAPSPRSQSSQRSPKQRRLIKDEMPMESEIKDATCADAPVLQECDDAEGSTSCSLKQEKQHEGSENQTGQECADADALEGGTRGLWSAIEWNAIVSNYEGKNDRSFT